jgi:hypothetical protein
MLSHQIVPIDISITILPCPPLLTDAPEQGQPIGTTGRV